MSFIHYKAAAVLLLLICTSTSTFASVIEGLVTDQKDAPLAGVTVSIEALHRATATSDDGRFRFQNINPGVYLLEFSSVGYQSQVSRLRVDTDRVELVVQLAQTILDLQPVTVTAAPQPTDRLTTPLSTAALHGRELSKLLGESLGETMQSLPGAATVSTGSSIAKPVIRGLSSQRVLVVSDGIRQEGQQWGDEHGPEIDPLGIYKIELVRGPGSILYGSDALGGVINVVTQEPPSKQHGDPQLAGQFTGQLFSGNDQGAAGLQLFGAHNKIGWRASLTGRDAADIRTPTSRLRNSGEQQLNGSAMVALSEPWGTAGLDFAHFGQELQIHEDPAEDAGATPYQKVAHDRVHLHLNIPTSKARFECNVGVQRNDRQEFEEANASEAVLRLKLRTTTVDLEAHHLPIGPLFGTVGLSFMDQKNESVAEEKLIPEFDLTNRSAFLFEQAIAGSFTFSGGLRYDNRSVAIKATDQLGVEDQTLTYDAVSGTVGTALKLTPALAITANAGRAWRAPSPFELFVNGVHEGTVRYEIGDRALKSEKSLSLDGSIRVVSNRLSAEWSFFSNAIDQYIYLSPTGEIDTASGFDIYNHTQTDATLFGSELSVEFAAADNLVLSGGYDLVRGTIDATDQPLPLVPADRFKLGARLTARQIGRLIAPYLSLRFTSVARQRRVAVYEEKSAGYSLIDLSIGGELPLGEQRLTFDLGANNLFDTAYRDHLSRYRSYAENMGRSFFAKVSIPITLVK